MTTARPAPPTIALVAALLLAVLASCSAGGPDHEPGDPPGKGVYVPLVWKAARTLNAHRVHVEREHVECSKCHAVTDDSMGPVTPDRCGACHEKQTHFRHGVPEAAARFGPDATVDCTACHVFTPTHAGPPPTPTRARPPAGLPNLPPLADVAAPTDCKRCHLEKQGNLPAVQVHGSSECVKCHQPHQDVKTSIGPCPECHEEKTLHGAAGKEPSQACVTCHSHQHAPASDALQTCTACHATHEPKVPATALFESGHRECVGCHRPHEFTKASAAPCRSCHEDVHVLGAPRVAAHEDCKSCHTPHDVRGAGDAACARCHQNVHPDHPKAQGKTCTGCHDPHPRAQGQAVARPCNGCHQVATSDKAFHGGTECERCHTPHAFGRKLSDHSLCQTCHTAQVVATNARAGHQACEGCHRGLPHRPERLKAPCGSCHTDVEHAVRMGHSRCTSCHEPHAGTVVAACGTCHAAEKRTARAGHATCTGCHDQHTGSPAAKPCNTCHQKEASTPHGALAQGCLSCHRPHGPGGVAAPPACATCHDRGKLPGLHSVVKHQECTQCHDGHQQRLPSLREVCSTCHKDRKDHFPEAPSCGSCHLFGKTR